MPDPTDLSLFMWTYVSIAKWKMIAKKFQIWHWLDDGPKVKMRYWNSFQYVNKRKRRSAMKSQILYSYEIIHAMKR